MQLLDRIRRCQRLLLAVLAGLALLVMVMMGVSSTLGVLCMSPVLRFMLAVPFMPSKWASSSLLMRSPLAVSLRHFAVPPIRVQHVE